jgi:hypothetical protein
VDSTGATGGEPVDQFGPAATGDGRNVPNGVATAPKVR